LDPLIKSRWSFVELVAVFPQLGAKLGLMHQWVMAGFPTVKTSPPPLAKQNNREHSFPYPTAPMSGVGRLDIRAPLAFNHLPPRSRDPDPDDLDRLAASLDHLTLFGREPSANKTG
jgi:hypothetical protein